jgi:trimeric autotransporter adhesin
MRDSSFYFIKQNSQQLKYQGGEKKVMKKSLSLVLAIAMVFSMFASVAFAAETTTTAPAKTTEEKYAELEKLGIFEGDGTGANLEGEMDRAQLAKIVTKLKGLTEDKAANTYTDVAADHWAAGFIGAVTKAKIFDGVAEGKFDPSGKVTLEQLAKVLVVTASLAQSNDAVTGEVSDWAKGYVAAAVKEFNLSAADYTVNALRGVFVELTYAAIGKITPIAPAVDVKAVGSKKIEVSFDKAVDAKKENFKILRGSSAQTIDTFEVNAAKTVVTLTTATKFTTADYTVEVSGVVEPKFTKTLSLKDEKVEKIEFPSDTLSLVRAPAGQANDNLAVETTYKVLNQYGEEINNTNVTFNASKGTLVAAKGHLTLTVTGGTYQAFTLNESVMISANYTDYTTGSFAQAQKTFKVGISAHVESVEIVGVSNYAKTEPTVGKPAVEYKLEVKAKDQYGNNVTNVNALKDDVRLYVSNPTIFTLDSTNNVNNFKKEDDKVFVELAGSQDPNANGTFLNAGKNTVTAYAVYGGKSVSYDVEVAAGKRVASFSIGAPDVAVAGETNTIPFTALDKDGKELNTAADFKTLNEIKLTSTHGSLKFEQDHVNNKTLLKLNVENVNATKEVPVPVFLTATVNQGKADMKFINATVNVKENARPVAITGVTDAKFALVNGEATTEIKHDKISIVDQYDRAYTLDDTKLLTYTVKLTKESGDSVSYDIDEIKANAKKITLTSDDQDVRGTTTFKLALYKNSVLINNSDRNVSFRVVKPEDLSDIAVDDVAKLYAAPATLPALAGAIGDYSKSLTVNGLLSDGTKAAVKLDDSRVYSVTSKVYGLTYTGGKLTAVNSELTAAGAPLNGTTNEAKLNVNVANGITGVTVNKEIVVSKVDPISTTFAVKTISGTSIKKLGDGVISVEEGDYTTALQLANTALEVKDQYGVVLTTGSKLTIATAMTLVDANGETLRNVKSEDIVAQATAGQTYQIVASTATGVSYTFKVVVK